MDVVNDIRQIIFEFVHKEYENYLKTHNILLIEEDKIYSVINDFYDTNKKSLNNTIRTTLKDKHKEDYPKVSATVENVILDIFQDKELNISKTTDEIKFIQKKNYNSFEIPIINNSLNLNISIVENYIVINSTNSKNITTQEHVDLYTNIDKYKFIYSINDKILENYENSEKINIIKSEIENKEKVKIGLYYLKN